MPFYNLKLRMDIKQKFWQKIRELRKEKWISQEKLAVKAKLHRTYIWMIERKGKEAVLKLQQVYKFINKPVEFPQYILKVI